MTSREQARKTRIKKIKIAQKQLGIEDVVYRDMLEARFGVRSCTKLTATQMDEFLSELKDRGADVYVKRLRQRPAPGIIELPSPGQWECINAIADDITWRAGRARGLRGYTRRMLGHDRPRDVAEAQKLIECLKHMRENQQKEKEAEYGR